jgi:hypothetical protein
VVELPRDQVLSVDKAQTNVPGTVVLIVVFGALMTLGILLAAYASQPSGPYI